uniref:Aminotransferase class V domain-containing protein n=1 Tax=Populus trichocarpa TaxID=3694 RepID=B9GKQ3_POPTR
MHSPCTGEASQACFHNLCQLPFLGIPEPQSSTSITTAASSRHDFEVAMASSMYPNSQFTNHESFPSLQESFSYFTKAFPLYSQTDQADKIREQEYYHLSLSNHVCLDYIGHGLFSYSQQRSYSREATVASTSSSSLPLRQYSSSLETPFFGISYKAANLHSQIQYGSQESELECKIQKRIMALMNLSEDDYTMVFTANQSSAFKLLADSYPFQSNQNLLTVYDHENEAVKIMIESSKNRGARVMSAEFSWKSLRIHSGKLLEKVRRKRKNRRGLFVFPLQSRMTGARYSYLWMNMARENGWHVLLDACGLGPKDMETLGLSLFKPDFLICSFFKVFGENPSGFGCLFVKKSSSSVIKDSTSTGLVRLVPARRPSQISEESANDDTETEEKAKQDGYSYLECRGLDHADSLGLISISTRARYLINWLVNALTSLQHPHSENGHPLVRIYGPKVKFDRGPAVAFNVFDWKGEKIDPAIVQKLADRNNISLSCGFLHHILFSNKYEHEREQILETRTSEGGTVLNGKRDKLYSGISVVTAALGFLTNFEDVYKLWAFVSRFLDADFVQKERWRYTALNQMTVEV